MARLASARARMASERRSRPARARRDGVAVARGIVSRRRRGVRGDARDARGDARADENVRDVRYHQIVARGRRLGRGAIDDARGFIVEFVALLERAEKERASGEGGAHAESREMTSAEISFPATRARAIADNMTEAEMKAPNETTLARRRELGAREEVDELIKAHALTRAIARRMKGLDTMPTSPEALAEALKRGDGSMSREARRAEAAAMRGAFPGNRPCPCGSTKKFKRCCGA